MVCQPHGNPPWIATSQESSAEKAHGTHLERETFFTQMANALTIFNGWVYLAQLSSCRARQQRCLGAMQDIVRHITQLMRHHGQNR
jgi:hypothetical protein